MLGQRLDRLHQWRRAATVNPLARAPGRHGFPNIEHLPALVVEVKLGTGGGKRAELLVKGRALATARSVDQPPGLSLSDAPANHRDDRRDADSAGDEQEAFGVGIEREIVARRTDLDLHAHAD